MPGVVEIKTNIIDMSHFVYILRCKDDSLYTGYTNRLIHRFIQHCSGKGAKYTKGRTPLDLVYVEEYKTKSEAMKREYQIKQLSRKAKQKLTGIL